MAHRTKPEYARERPRTSPGTERRRRHGQALPGRAAAKGIAKAAVAAEGIGEEWLASGASAGMLAGASAGSVPIRTSRKKKKVQ